MTYDTVSSNPDAKGLPEGRSIFWYRVGKVLGCGGFGITYHGIDTNLDREVALKEYFPREVAVRGPDGEVRSTSEEVEYRYRLGLERFIAEAKTLAQIKHPNIVQVFSVLEANNSAYLVMEFERGLNLEELLRTQGWWLHEVTIHKFIRPLTDALQYLHTRACLHCDVKPMNVFIRSDDSPVLLDFGAARSEFNTTLDAPNFFSHGYSPIEQYDDANGTVGPWSDIYALGATLYAIINRGDAPSDACTRFTALSEGQRDPLPSAASVGKGRYSDALLTAIDAALAIHPGERPQSVDDWRLMFPAIDQRGVDEPADWDLLIDPKVGAALLSEQETKIQIAALKISDDAKTAYFSWLVEKLSHSRAEEKLAAMMALFELKYPELEHWLLKLTAERRMSVRRLAVFYLGEIRAKSAIPAVSALMSDSLPEIRAEARDAYRKIRES